MSEGLVLIASGVALIVLALWIILKLRRAAACKRHDPRAGVVAMILAAGCLIIGLVSIQLGIVGA